MIFIVKVNIKIYFVFLNEYKRRKIMQKLLKMKEFLKKCLKTNKKIIIEKEQLIDKKAKI